MLVIALAAMLLAAPEPAQPGAGPPDSPEMAAARANLTRVAAKVAFKTRVEAEFPEAARAAGEFGKVKVEGIVGLDGRISQLRVVESSRSERLDASSLAAAAATVFEPARDEAGRPIVVLARVPYDFSNARSPGEGGGVLRYRCDQFARDYDWWYRTWGEDQADEFYTMVLGYTTIVAMNGQGGSRDIAKVLGASKTFRVRWNRAIADCRAAPDRLFIDIFQPEGRMMKALASSPAR